MSCRCFVVGWMCLLMQILCVPGMSLHEHERSSHACLDPIAPPLTDVEDVALGDLRRFAGKVVAFSSRLPKAAEETRVGYELRIRQRERVGLFVRKLMARLGAYSRELGDRYEVGVLALRLGIKDILVFYHSWGTDHVSKESFEAALAELYRRIPLEIPGIRSVIRRLEGKGIAIHRMHTHPEDHSAPHSGVDIISDLKRSRELQNSFGLKSRFLSHVVPLQYSGQLLFTFEPPEHRVY